jgi:hypothetical protein
VSTNAARDGGYRKVKITAARRSKLLDVRSRPGYVAASK